MGLTPSIGFLSGNEVKAQGALNAGLRKQDLSSSPKIALTVSLVDQTFALRWVQNYVRPICVCTLPTLTTVYLRSDCLVVTKLMSRSGVIPQVPAPFYNISSPMEVTLNHRFSMVRSPVPRFCLLSTTTTIGSLR